MASVSYNKMSLVCRIVQVYRVITGWRTRIAEESVSSLYIQSPKPKLDCVLVVSLLSMDYLSRLRWETLDPCLLPRHCYSKNSVQIVSVDRTSMGSSTSPGEDNEEEPSLSQRQAAFHEFIVRKTHKCC